MEMWKCLTDLQGNFSNTREWSIIRGNWVRKEKAIAAEFWGVGKTFEKKIDFVF